MRVIKAVRYNIQLQYQILRKGSGIMAKRYQRVMR